MKKAFITISAMALILGFMLYTTSTALKLEKRENALLSTQITINELLSPASSSHTVIVDCSQLTIKENFDSFYKWHINVQTVVYKTQQGNIVFSGKNSISKSWFPPREPHEHSGFGNSVSTKEASYTLAVENKDRSNSILSHINKIKQLCQK